MVDINELPANQDDDEEEEENDAEEVDEDTMDAALEIGRNVGETTGVSGEELGELIWDYYNKLKPLSDDTE